MATPLSAPEPVATQQIDHFAAAERLLAETRREDQQLPFVRAKLIRADIHAKLAQVQAIREAFGPHAVEVADVATAQVKDDLL